MVSQERQHRASAGPGLVIPPSHGARASSAPAREGGDIPSSAVKLGWILCLAGAAIRLYGHNSTGNPSLIDWYSNTPWWFAQLLPNVESETGTAVVFLGALLIYWPFRRR
jgi:hypothetical protein